MMRKCNSGSLSAASRITHLPGAIRATVPATCSVEGVVVFGWRSIVGT